MQALCLHYEGEAKLDIRATKAQQELDTLVYTNECTMPFKTLITRLNKAYNVLKKHGQEFTDKSKVEQLAKRIKNPTNNITITVTVDIMREAHKANYTAAVQFITARMVQINSATINAPGPNPHCISEGNTNNNGGPRTEFNGVNICNPFRTFTDQEKFLLGERGAAVVEELKDARQNNNGGGGGRGRGRGHGGYGRGGRGYHYHRDCSNNTNNDGGANANNGGGNRNINEASSSGWAGQNDQPQQSSNSSVSSSNAQSQASTSNGEHGGQNGSRFGNNRP